MHSSRSRTRTISFGPGNRYKMAEGGEILIPASFFLENARPVVPEEVFAQVHPKCLEELGDRKICNPHYPDHRGIFFVVAKHKQSEFLKFEFFATLPGSKDVHSVCLAASNFLLYFLPAENDTRQKLEIINAKNQNSERNSNSSDYDSEADSLEGNDNKYEQLQSPTQAAPSKNRRETSNESLFVDSEIPSKASPSCTEFTFVESPHVNLEKSIHQEGMEFVEEERLECAEKCSVTEILLVQGEESCLVPLFGGEENLCGQLQAEEIICDVTKEAPEIKDPDPIRIDGNLVSTMSITELLKHGLFEKAQAKRERNKIRKREYRTKSQTSLLPKKPKVAELRQQIATLSAIVLDTDIAGVENTMKEAEVLEKKTNTDQAGLRHAPTATQRELQTLSRIISPDKKPNFLIDVVKEAAGDFFKGLFKYCCSQQNPTKKLKWTEVVESNLSAIDFALQHVLFYEAVFLPEGHLDIEKTFGGNFESLDAKNFYGVTPSTFRANLAKSFKGLRVVRNYGDPYGFISPQYWLASYCKGKADAFLVNRPEAASKAYISDEQNTVTGNYDKMSRMVYVSRDNYERVFTAQQHSYTTSAQDVFKLSQAIRSMKERTITMFEEGGIQNFNLVISLVRRF